MAWSLHLLSLKKCYQAVSAWSFRRLVVTFDLLKVSFEHDDDKGDIWAQWWQLWHLVIRIVIWWWHLWRQYCRQLKLHFRRQQWCWLSWRHWQRMTWTMTLTSFVVIGQLMSLKTEIPFFCGRQLLPPPVNRVGPALWMLEAVFGQTGLARLALSNQAANYLYSLQEE